MQTALLGLHQAVYQRTDGRLGHRLIGVPSLILRTTGHRSGLTRTAVLTYGRDGGGYVVVASNGGQDRPPAWLHNARANPVVGIQVGRWRTAGRARIVEAGDPDYPRLWQLVNQVNRGRYDGYQRRTTRPIAPWSLRRSPPRLAAGAPGRLSDGRWRVTPASSIGLDRRQRRRAQPSTHPDHRPTPSMAV